MLSLQGAAAFTSSANLSLQLAVQGLGPRFKLLVTMRNDGASHLRDLPLLLLYNQGLYSAAKRQLVVPLLVPTVSYTLEVGISRKVHSSLAVVALGLMGRHMWGLWGNTRAMQLVAPSRLSARRLLPSVGHCILPLLTCACNVHPFRWP